MKVCREYANVDRTNSSLSNFLTFVFSVIQTTALIPGRKAPILVNEEMLGAMKAGSVCVDLAAANGGNVAQTRPDEIVTSKNGVKIIGYTDLPSRLASTASNLVRILRFHF